MMENKYFEELFRQGCEFTEKKEAHKELKKEIIKKYGWDSDELKKWYKDDEAMKFPLSAGTQKALRAWMYGQEQDGFIQMDDFLWEGEAKDFVETLRKAGIEGINLTNTSTALMENIHWLEEEGCKMTGTSVVIKKSEWFGKERVEKVMGIRFLCPVF